MSTRVDTYYPSNCILKPKSRCLFLACLLYKPEPELAHLDAPTRGSKICASPTPLHPVSQASKNAPPHAAREQPPPTAREEHAAPRNARDGNRRRPTTLRHEEPWGASEQARATSGEGGQCNDDQCDGVRQAQLSDDELHEPFFNGAERGDEFQLGAQPTSCVRRTRPMAIVVSRVRRRAYL